MKNIKISLFILLVLSGMVIKGQNNLIHNAVIEQPINVASPYAEAMVDDRSVAIGPGTGLEVWEDQLKSRTITDEFGTVEKLLHSPEWFMVNKFNYNISKFICKEATGAVWQDVQPHSGKGYMGMGPGELVQQQFFNANKFESGKNYTFNFYIRPIEDINIFNYSDWSEGLDLKVFLRKNKMKYSFTANLVKNRCDPLKYFQKEDMNNTINVLDYHVDISMYPVGNWYPVTVEFEAPDDSYDWIVIETQSSIEDICGGPYLLLDDFTLSQTCEFPSCDRDGGEVFPYDNGVISYDVPLKITNLNNATDITVEVVTVQGQLPVWSYNLSCTNGIQDPIYWDGRTFSGTYAANAPYILKVTSINDCGTEISTSQFIKQGNYSPIINNNIICNVSGVETPLPCCDYQPDLIVDNTTLPGVGLLDYRVNNKINVAPTGPVTVLGSAEVEMRAGYEIVINPGFSVIPGGYYLAEIVPCNESGELRASNVKMNYLSLTKEQVILDAQNENERRNLELNQEEDLDLSIYPNPSNGQFTIDIGDAENVNLTIYNMQGKQVYSNSNVSEKLSVDLLEQPQGIYLVKIISGADVKVKRIIKK